MVNNDSVLERKVIHPGKPFIKAGEEHARAYIVQSGLISAYIIEGNKKIEVSQYGPGRIIGEICLMSDEAMDMNYEALTDTTVVTMTRQEFQKKISKMDRNVWTILEHVMNKLNYQYKSDIGKAKAHNAIDETAQNFVQSLLTKIAPEKRGEYERALTPHVNALLREMRALRGQGKPQE
jgi:CRP/FNR family cyclic AMP-dependent transcriptional regulator